MISKYFPQFIWDLWLSTGPSLASRPPRVHIYDAYTNDLTETHKPQASGSSNIFCDLDIGLLSVETLQALRDAERSFLRLENQVSEIIREVLERTVWGDDWNARRRAQCKDSRTNSLPLTLRDVETLRNYFLFVRFRNSEGYQQIFESLQESYTSGFEDGCLFSAYSPLIVQLRLRHVLQDFTFFLEHTATESHSKRRHKEAPIVDTSLNNLHNLMDLYCWRFSEAELCIGIATEDQEFILSDKCFGTLDEGLIENPECCDLFFPVLPTLALYIIGASTIDDPSPSSLNPNSTVWIDVGLESAIDVHLRNACVLQTHVSFLYFGSLRSIALSISSYDEFRWTEEHLDYSRLKQRCRQKFLQETVTKMLVVKGSIKVVDLTDDVVIMGDSAVAHGAFSDVWMGMWEDPMDKKTKKVALKFLRQIMVNNVREKLVKRLQAEVLAWHRLCHRNVSQLFGIVQSPTSIAMVSQWCSNGTLCSYTRHNPAADRLGLLTQVASGITYLHTVKPTIVHGDLKGGNILIDDAGTPIITDFGLSKVLEEMSGDLPLNGGTMATSFFAGSTRWMAPELVMALVEDDDKPPPLTTASDVYAFASICLEVASGKLPYANRTNDHAVTVDILRGIRPMMGETCLLQVKPDGQTAFRAILCQCWAEDPTGRPSMAEVSLIFDVLNAQARHL